MATNQIKTNQIADGAIDNEKVKSNAGIESSKLADGLNFIQKGGSVAFTADQSMGGSKLTNLGTPTASTDATTKAYVDSMQQGLDTKQSVRVATTANITLSGTQTIDGVSVIAGDRVLVKNQTTVNQNGIYVVASGSWTRATDMDAWSDVPGAYVFVEEGTTNSDQGFVCTSNTGGTLGTTDITWVKFTNAVSGLLATSFVFNETPTGSVNGVNTSFSLTNTPVSGTVQLFRNGLLQEEGSGEDYTISGNTITYQYAPATGEQLRASYIIS